ncbi:endonuclease III [Flavihumibacter stibioxidans]|uniref:Endonuclease III n=1 Tax=Flavihumibacter stibioxidans TaxID=1834163 RepID=A0ABR7M7U7_9BACT|nr:endonuclease III [Flavihumibacter stibioxidans]MBC6491120.1 endonuclease III [Flavihumibacter stibioxidans]
MTTKERYQKLIEYFQQKAPDAETELLYDNPFQLLVAVVLSAQCTDKRVNLTTPALFERFPNPKSLADSSVEEVFSLIRSISYPNNKAKHLVGLGKMLEEKFNGRVPMTVEELVQIPGVGRKTANVITSVIDAQPNMAVDTHVFRVSERIGLTTHAKTPLAAEKQLISRLPKELIHKAHHWLILHGRYVCTARAPKCESCGLQEICRFYRKQMAKKSVKTTQG